MGSRQKRKRPFRIIVTAACAVICGISLSIQPWQHYMRQKQAAEKARIEMRQAESERAQLLRKKAYYESPSGKEQLARERNYVKPGEKRLEVR